MFRYTQDLCRQVAEGCKTRAEFKRANRSAYNVARIHGWLNEYVWFVDGRKLPRRWTDEKCIEEARKYRRKVDFMKKSPGAYHHAAKVGLLNAFDWMENCAINLEYGKIYCIYRYVFAIEGKKYVYIGLTLRPVVRDRQHHRGDSAVYAFAQKHCVDIPKMEIVERNLTQSEAREREDAIRRIYEGTEEFVVLNKAQTGRNVGSVGGMHRKWSRARCYEEAKKFSSRGEFEKKSGSAYCAALEKGWMCDYTWFKTIHRPAWTREAFLAEAHKYKSIKELAKNCMGACIAGRLRGWIDECSWFEEGQGWAIRVERKRSDSRVVCQYSMDGRLIAKYSKLADAIRATGIMSIRKCLIGERKQAGGFFWKYDVQDAGCK